MTEPTDIERSRQPQISSEKLVDTYLAEYAAITNRCTYWIAIQAGFLPVQCTIIAFGAQSCFSASSSTTRNAILWISLFLFQLVGAALQKMLYEQYTATNYLEVVVRPSIQRLCSMPPPENSKAGIVVNTAETLIGGVLSYETYLRNRRAISFVPGWWWNFVLLILVAPALVVIGYVSGLDSPGDKAGFIINTLLFGFCAWQVKGIVKEHKPLVGR